MSDKLTGDVHGHVLCMGFNRPDKYNAMDLDAYRQLADAYGRLQHDDTLRCGLLFGHGQHFTAGLELDKWSPAFVAGGFPEIGPDAIDRPSPESAPIMDSEDAKEGVTSFLERREARFLGK